MKYSSWNPFYTAMLITKDLDIAEKKNKDIEAFFRDIVVHEDVIFGLRIAVKDTFPQYTALLEKVLSGTTSSENKTITKPSEES